MPIGQSERGGSSTEPPSSQGTLVYAKFTKTNQYNIPNKMKTDADFRNIKKINSEVSKPNLKGPLISIENHHEADCAMLKE